MNNRALNLNRSNSIQQSLMWWLCGWLH